MHAADSGRAGAAPDVTARVSGRCPKDWPRGLRGRRSPSSGMPGTSWDAVGGAVAGATAALDAGAQWPAAMVVQTRGGLVGATAA